MKNVNYSDKMVAEMESAYTENPTMDTVKHLASTMGKTDKSIIAKLVSLGVYKKKERATKSGAKIVTKADLVSQINTHFGMELPSLVKATKIDLQNLVDTF